MWKEPDRMILVIGWGNWQNGGAFAELEKTGEDSEMGKGKKLSFGSIVIKLFVTILIWDGKEEIEWGWGSKEKFILWM